MFECLHACLHTQGYTRDNDNCCKCVAIIVWFLCKSTFAIFPKYGMKACSHVSLFKLGHGQNETLAM